MIKKIWRGMSAALLTLLLSIQPVYADDDLCLPFKDASIDEVLIQKMLTAAKLDQLYRINKDSSRMGFSVDSPLGMVSGDFRNFQGGITMQGEGSQSMVLVEVDSLTTDVKLIESMLKGDDFFNVDHFPQLIFVSTDFEWIGNNRAVLKGQLSMHGITKDVAFYVTLEEEPGELGDSNTLIVKATTTVQRSEFGMEALLPMVDDKVNLSMTVTAERYYADS